MQAKLVHSKTTNPAQQQTVPLMTGLQDERKGMVLKWYLNSQTVPIYQWIPPSRPQGLGAMRGKIDLDFEISKGNPATVFMPKKVIVKGTVSRDGFGF